LADNRNENNQYEKGLDELPSSPFLLFDRRLG